MIRVSDSQPGSGTWCEWSLRFALRLAARLLYRVFCQSLQGDHAMTEMTLYWMSFQPCGKPPFENGDCAVDILLR